MACRCDINSLYLRIVDINCFEHSYLRAFSALAPTVDNEVIYAQSVSYLISKLFAWRTRAVTRQRNVRIWDSRSITCMSKNYTHGARKCRYSSLVYTYVLCHLCLYLCIRKNHWRSAERILNDVSHARGNVESRSPVNLRKTPVAFKILTQVFCFWKIITIVLLLLAPEWYLI